MQVGELATLLTALAVVVGAAWTVVNGRRQRAHEDSASLWANAMDIIDQLRQENDDLKDEVWQLKHPTSRPRRRRRTPTTATTTKEPKA